MERDFKDLLSTLNEGGVRYLIVGGYAVIKHTEPRYTKDLDIWVSRDKRNAEQLFKSLQTFGAPLKGLSPADFDSARISRTELNEEYCGLSLNSGLSYPSLNVLIATAHNAII